MMNPSIINRYKNNFNNNYAYLNSFIEKKIIPLNSKHNCFCKSNSISNIFSKNSGYLLLNSNNQNKGNYSNNKVNKRIDDYVNSEMKTPYYNIFYSITNEFYKII